MARRSWARKAGTCISWNIPRAIESGGEEESRGIFPIRFPAQSGDLPRRVPAEMLHGAGKLHECLPPVSAVTALSFACVDGVVAAVAFSQLLRIHLQNRQVGWTRQKVFHLLIGSSNVGYMVYFLLTLLASSKGWSCWSHACGFFLMAFPQILFVATFLLLLSFWVDLCHQANDVEEDEDDYVYQLLLEKSKSRAGVQHVEGRRKCCPVLAMRIGSRQKIVILITLFLFSLAIATSVLVWVGTGKNPIDSSLVARVPSFWILCINEVFLLNEWAMSIQLLFFLVCYLVYLDLFAAVMLALAGGLACYGSLLFSKMSKVRSERASSEIRKVAGLAAVSVVCFTICALVALVTDIPVWNNWQSKDADGVYTSLLIILYYLIGSSVPSSTVLWVMRDMPPRPTVIAPPGPVTVTTDRRTTPPQRWITSTSAQNQVLRASPI